jgi:hypothetical protein
LFLIGVARMPRLEVPAAKTEGRIVMKGFVVALMLLAACTIGSSLRAQQPSDCKICREQHKACVLAHSKAACTTEYEVCMKHCRRK